MTVPLAVTAAFGLLIGSFLNVVAWRLPRRESLVSPRSACPDCGTAVRAYDNVPVLSWLLLRARCRDCGAHISARYPVVELVTALLFAAVVAVKGVDGDAALGLALVTLLVPVALIDYEHRIIPNRLLLPGALIGLVILAVTDRGALPEHLVAAVAAGGFLLVAALAYPSGMGMGDVKLAAVLGLFLGRAVAPALLIALLAGVVVGIVVMARKGTREGRKTAVPFGPFLALGGLAGLFAGSAIVDWYSGTFL